MAIPIHTDLLRLLAVCYLDSVIACTTTSGGVPMERLLVQPDLTRPTTQRQQHMEMSAHF